MSKVRTLTAIGDYLNRHSAGFASWRIDDDDDLTLVLFGCVNLTYYKWDDSTVIALGRKGYRPASKHVWRAIQSVSAVSRV